MMGDDIPLAPVVPEVLEGDKLILEERRYVLSICLPNEVENSVAYYVPSEQALIAGDLIFSKMHAYFADLITHRLDRGIATHEVHRPGKDSLSGSRSCR